MKRKRFLVTGSSGFVGRALSMELVRRHYDVRCAIRSVSDRGGLPGELVKVSDIGAHTDWEEALADVDIVVHLAARVHVMKEEASDPLTAFRAVNVDGTEKLARDAVAMGVKRIVYVSSIGVNGNFTRTGAFSENDKPAPYDAYTTSKYEAEQVLRRVADKTALDVVIIRPPLVYGPNNPGNFLRLLKLVEKGIPLPLARVRNSRSMIYLSNLVDALITCALHPAAAGQTYMVSDGDDVSTSRLIHEIARLMAKPARLWGLPPSILRCAGKSIGKSSELEKLIGSLVINCEKIHSELDWAAPYTLEEGLAETVKWFQSKSKPGRC